VRREKHQLRSKLGLANEKRFPDITRGRGGGRGRAREKEKSASKTLRARKRKKAE